MRAIGYVRVSTELQATEGVSLEAQRARLRAWCAANGAALAEADLFADEGLSGKRSDNRPALQAALERVCACRGVLVVYSLSRLARSTRDTLAIAEQLDKAGADLVSMSEKIDTTSASGKMVFRLLAVLAEFERDLVSERTRTSLAHKKSKSERVGAVPYGFDLDPDGPTNAKGRPSHLVPVASEQAVLARIHQMKARGWSSRRIAQALNEDGVSTKTGRGPWIHTAVAKILKRRS